MTTARPPLHPESLTTLRQLVRLHGAEAIIRAVRTFGRMSPAEKRERRAARRYGRLACMFVRKALDPRISEDEATAHLASVRGCARIAFRHARCARDLQDLRG